MKDEMAQPDQEVSVGETPGRSPAPLAVPLLVGGRAESGSEVPYLRAR